MTVTVSRSPSEQESQVVCTVKVSCCTQWMCVSERDECKCCGSMHRLLHRWQLITCSINSNQFQSFKFVLPSLFSFRRQQVLWSKWSFGHRPGLRHRLSQASWLRTPAPLGVVPRWIPQNLRTSTTGKSTGKSIGWTSWRLSNCKF